MRLKIKEVIWYFLALIALLILVYMEKNIIVDTYLYVVTLNILILLLPYAILKKMNSLHYYSYVTGCLFFIVWFSFYALNMLRSKSIRECVIEDVQAKQYTRIGIAGRASSSGITCEYKGSFIHISATTESEEIYKIYGDSVINHLKVRLFLKETLPNVYYINDIQIHYIK